VILVGLVVVAGAVRGAFGLFDRPRAGLFILVFVSSLAGLHGFLLHSPKAQIIFSDDYADIVARTPHLRPRSGLALKLLAVLLITLLGLAMPAIRLLVLILMSD
jgi:hypothetical protein